MIEYFNEDCLEGMARYPDKHFDLAIVDPPYGVNINHNMGRRKGQEASKLDKVRWDNEIPSEEYFKELERVSKHRIIWGANYYQMPPTKCFIVWRKTNISEGVSFSMLEYAWSSFDSTSKEWIGMSNEKHRIHPTQKPVALYILDTHVGSASSLIACHDLGFDAVGFELDPDYYKASQQRLNNFMAQMKIEDISNNIPDKDDKPEQITMCTSF